jgi:hypothetical protein
LRFGLAFENVDHFIVTEFTSIDINDVVCFWFPFLKILVGKFPNIDVNGEFASIKAYDIGNLACYEVRIDRLANDNGGSVRKRSGNKENVNLHD